MNPAWQLDLDAERDAWRAALGSLGYSDDGESLRGTVPWTHPDGRSLLATIQLTLDSSFPFSPPKVKVLDPGTDLELTFHREATGHLCLWSPVAAVEDAPWRGPDRVVMRVAEWLVETAAGWPGDDDCDLERYLSTDPRIVFYDADKLSTTSRCVRTTSQPGHRVHITDVPQEPRGPWTASGRRNRRAGRRDRHLAWIADIGVPSRPISDWASLMSAVDADAAHLDRLVRFGVVEFVVIKYHRAGNDGVLAIAVRPPGISKSEPLLTACESADTSAMTRRLRAGPIAHEIATMKVAVVGVGAVGSFIADILFRSGVGNLTLIDPQVLRPGNLVRHLAGEQGVGLPKSTAVKIHLSDLGLDTGHIDDRRDLVSTPADAIKLLRANNLVVDATASGLVTSLFAWATSYVASTPVVSVCVQREGAIARVDRFPLRGNETRLPIAPAGPQQVLRRERGCDDPVSITPPSAVLAAAVLASRVAIDELTNNRTIPASVVNVLEAVEEPYHQLGTLLGASR